MLAEEVRLWEKYLFAHGHQYSSILYDVRVGAVPSSLSTIDPRWRSNVDALYRKRIDAVGLYPGGCHIIEVKSVTGTGTYGQLLAYMSLYEKENNDILDITGILVCKFCDEILKGLFEEAGIEIFEYPEN